jgi:predicted AAA+ superfamily ATPase
MPEIVRAEAELLRNRVVKTRRHMQVVAGPRQVGKTTMVRWAIAEATARCRLFYWRAGNREVDFVVERAVELLAVEVKSGRRRCWWARTA